MLRASRVCWVGPWSFSLGRLVMAYAQGTDLFSARSRIVSMLRAALSASSSAWETPCSAETGASASSANSLPSNALSRDFAMSAMLSHPFMGEPQVVAAPCHVSRTLPMHQAVLAQVAYLFRAASRTVTLTLPETPGHPCYTPRDTR